MFSYSCVYFKPRISLLLITVIKAEANLWERDLIWVLIFSEHYAKQKELLEHKYTGCIVTLVSAILGTH